MEESMTLGDEVKTGVETITCKLDSILAVGKALNSIESELDESEGLISE